MISDKFFKINIDWEDNTPLVTVRHKVTNQKLSASTKKHSVDKKTDELKHQLISQFYNPKDIKIDTGRSLEGTFILITHLPTGECLTQNGIKKESIFKVKERLLDELMLSLWDSGV